MNETVIPAGVRAIFFDAVGTLIHPEPSAPTVYAEIGRRHGSRLDEATIATRFRSAFQREEAVDHAADWRTSEAREVERWRRIVGEVLSDASHPEACFQALFEHFGRPHAWRAEPEAESLLAVLKQRGFALGIASNYDHRLRTVAAGMPLFSSVEHWAISSEIGWRKPAPEFFVAICARAQQPAARVLVVGDDRENDYEGARASGLGAVLIDPESRFPGTVSIARLRDLLALLSVHR
ncbi:MAG TPA: HAD-IA family hydrolase [Gemmataceae bacterium]|nr:HAD-IA family hydrolase [Gemmataceae bacterium]